MDRGNKMKCVLIYGGTSEDDAWSLVVETPALPAARDGILCKGGSYMVKRAIWQVEGGSLNPMPHVLLERLGKE
jgi:hypothetical protein